MAPAFPAAILVFRQGKPDTSVLFIDGSHQFQEGTNQNRLRVSDIATLVDTYRRRETVDKYAYRAMFEEIQANDFNLNIPRYVNTFEAEAAIDVAALQVQIDALEGELATVQGQLG